MCTYSHPSAWVHTTHAGDILECSILPWVKDNLPLEWWWLYFDNFGPNRTTYLTSKAKTLNGQCLCLAKRQKHMVCSQLTEAMSVRISSTWAGRWLMSGLKARMPGKMACRKNMGAVRMWKNDRFTQKGVDDMDFGRCLRQAHDRNNNDRNQS